MKNYQAFPGEIYQRTAYQSGQPSFLRNYTDQQILALEDIFLSRGLKQLTVPSQVAGRELVVSMVELFYHTGRVACLTANGSGLPERVTRIFEEMAVSGCLAFANRDIDSFLLEQFYYDVVWVECSDQLLAMPWFGYFESKLLEFNMSATCPIIFVMCDDTQLLTAGE